MDPKTLEALHGSIAKWEAIVAGTGKDHGCENCPLCILFDEPDCGDCPVKQRTGRPFCEGSPYAVYGAYGTAGKTKENAQAELDFLRSLLPTTFD